MRGKQVQEEDVEEHVSTSLTCLGSVLMPSADDAGQGEVSGAEKTKSSSAERTAPWLSGRLSIPPGGTKTTGRYG